MICLKQRKRNIVPGIGKNQCGGAIKKKCQYQQRKKNALQWYWHFSPYMRCNPCKYADPEHTGDAKSQCRIKTDITAKLQWITMVIPVTQVENVGKEPPDKKFYERAEKRRKKKDFDRMLLKTS